MKRTANGYLWLLVALLPMWGTRNVAAQTGAAVVGPEPAALTVAAGQTQTIAIVVENAADVYGIDVRATFDPALIEVVDADPAHNGVQMTAGVFPQPDFVALNLADNAAGALRYAVTQVNPTPPASGNGVIFSFQVRGRASGVSSLRVVLVEMANRSGELLSVTTRDGAITVTGGQPPASTGIAVTIAAEGGAPTAPGAATTGAPSPAVATQSVATEAPATPAPTASAATTAATTAADATTDPAGGPTAPAQPATGAATEPAGLATATAVAPGEPVAAATAAPPVEPETTANQGAALSAVTAGTGSPGSTASEAPVPPAVVGAGTDATSPNATPPAAASPGGALLIGGVVVLLLVAVGVVLARRR